MKETNKTIPQDQEGFRSKYIKVKNKLGFTFHIPFIDVRDGEDARKAAKSLISRSNQSKYLRPSESVIGIPYTTSIKQLKKLLKEENKKDA